MSDVLILQLFNYNNCYTPKKTDAIIMLSEITLKLMNLYTVPDIKFTYYHCTSINYSVL